MLAVPRTSLSCLALLVLVTNIYGCPPSDDGESEDGETVPVSGQVTVDGRGVEGALVEFADVDSFSLRDATTVAGGNYDAEVPVDRRWEVTVDLTDALCPTEYFDSGEASDGEVNLPCVSGDGAVEVTYTPVENDCGLPTRDEFSAEAEAATRVEDESFIVAWTFTDGPEPITVQGVYDAASGTFIGETPQIAFEGGEGKEIWELVLDYRATATEALPDIVTFVGEVEAQYTFDVPDRPGETFECREILAVEVEYTTAAPPACGNGIPDGGEECDDGNRMSGDGCSSTCRVEF